jgi:hypothetical protein
MPSKITASVPKPTGAGRERSNSIDQSGAQSPCRPHIRSQWPRYAGPSRGSGGAAPVRNIVARSRGISMMAHQTLVRRRLHRPPCIPPTAWEMKLPRAHDRSQALPPSWTPSSRGPIGAHVSPLTGPALLCHGLEEKKKQRPISPTTLSPISRSLSTSLSFQPHGRRWGGDGSLCERT